MNIKNRLFSGLMILTFLSAANGAPLNIPLNTLTNPSWDLVDKQGKIIMPAEIVKQFEENQDVSVFNPMADKYWQVDISPSHELKKRVNLNRIAVQKSRNKFKAKQIKKHYSNINTLKSIFSETTSSNKIAAIDTELHQKMPNAKDTLYYQEELGAIRELSLYGFTASPSKNGVESTQRYGITLGGTVHYSLLRAALLRKLGFNQQSPKYASELRIKFKNEKQKEEFIKQAFCGSHDLDESNLNCLPGEGYKNEEGREYIKEVAGDKLALDVIDVYIENYDSETPSLIDGITPATGSLVTYLGQSRAYRALSVIFAITNLRENIESIETAACQLQLGTAQMNVPFDFQFSSLDHSDAKWILRKMSSLTQNDWNEIIQAAHFPKYSQTLQGKVMRRFESCVKSFFDEADLLKGYQSYQVKESSAKLLSHLTIPSIQSQITERHIPGWNQRISAEDVQSPLVKGTYKTIFNLVALNSLLGAAESRFMELLNNKIGLNKENQKVEGIKIDSEGSHYLVHGGGRSAGLIFSTNRSLSSGSYYGSDATVQIVDNLTIGVEASESRYKLNYDEILRTLGIKAYKTRDYTHVRPVSKITDIKEIPWKDVAVKNKIKDLLEPVLNGGDISAFFDLKNFAVGEVFIVSDGYGGQASFGVTQIMNNLLGFYKSPLTLGINVGGSYALQDQIQIIRTPQGFNLIIRKRKDKAISEGFSLKQFIKILTLSNEDKDSEIGTKSYLVKINTDLIKPQSISTEDGASQEEVSDAVKKAQEEELKKAKTFASIIKDLLLNGETTEDKLNLFKHQLVEFNQNLASKETMLNLLWLRNSQFEEMNTTQIKKPHQYIPAEIQQQIDSGEVDVEKNVPVNLTTYKKGEMAARDYLGFTGHVLESYLSEKHPKLSFSLGLSKANPAYMPFGRTQWHVIRTESVEDSKSYSQYFPTVARIQNVWGGWSIKKNELDTALRVLQNKFKGTRWENIDIFPKGTFDHVQKIDFFRMTENYSLLPSAIDKIKDYFINPANDKNVPVVTESRFFLTKIFSKLSQLGSDHKINKGDDVILNHILIAMGYDGTGENYLEKGKEKYSAYCKAQKKHQQASESSNDYTGEWKNGRYYDCLDSWASELMNLSRHYNKANYKQKNKILGEIIFALEKVIQPQYVLDLIGEKNYVYFVEVVGFRVGDAAEKADNGVIVSKNFGLPETPPQFVNGLAPLISEYFGGIPLNILNMTNTSVD